MSNNEWSAPVGYKITTEHEMNELVNDTGTGRVIDNAELLAKSLFELNHPDRLGDVDSRKRYISEIMGQGATFGTWFHYPWDDTLMRFPDEDDWYRLRTFRNCNLVTAEQAETKLRHRKVAWFGLSIGSESLDAAVRAGIGSEHLLFDPDILEAMNLNRVDAGGADLGLLKTTVSGRKTSKLDPYVRQQHFPKGYVGEETDNLLRTERPDAIIEEVDDIQVKAQVRRIAKELKIPLIMAGDVDKKSTIDVELHDRTDVKPFNGKLSEELFDRLAAGAMPSTEQDSILIKILGLRNISPQLIKSAMAKDRGELAGFPQLGTTATAGAQLSVVALREMFLGRLNRSVTGVHDPRDILKYDRPTTRLDDVRTVVRFIGHQLRMRRAASRT